MKSWCIIALALLASPMFGLALPTSPEQGSSEAIRRSDDPEALAKKQKGGACGHDEQTFGNLSYCQDACRGGGCAPHIIDTGVFAGGGVVEIYECIC
ncbi:hypothetical protein F4776DRAFT_251701 [Hypoxylon sp. NC0597]|nr:hypothetical protein F4776DRAFT_251701 [Hypoxylon sp. NC0597]